MRMTGPAPSAESDLVCPTWAGRAAGPYSGPHPKVSLPEQLARTTLAESQQRINSKASCLRHIFHMAECPELALALCSGKMGALGAGVVM